MKMMRNSIPILIGTLAAYAVYVSTLYFGQRSDVTLVMGAVAGLARNVSAMERMMKRSRIEVPAPSVVLSEALLDAFSAEAARRGYCQPVLHWEGMVMWLEDANPGAPNVEGLAVVVSSDHVTLLNENLLMSDFVHVTPPVRGVAVSHCTFETVGE